MMWDITEKTYAQYGDDLKQLEQAARGSRG
jgi:hypothetical protein